MQQEYLQTEEVQQQMERQKYMKMLKTEIADLQRLDNKSDEEILRHIYKTYPPVNKKHKLPIDKKKELTRGLQKKALQKAILHYDPEKVDVEAHGLRTKYLYTEISKLLAKHHSHIKIWTLTWWVCPKEEGAWQVCHFVCVAQTELVVRS